MNEPWWTWIIAPDALRAGLILAALFGLHYAAKRWRYRIVFAAELGVWHGLGGKLVSPPWPLHARLGLFTVDVLRRIYR